MDATEAAPSRSMALVFRMTFMIIFGGEFSAAGSHMHKLAKVVTRGSSRENNGEERARDTGTESNKIQVGNDRPLVLSSFPVHRNTFFQ